MDFSLLREENLFARFITIRAFFTLGINMQGTLVAWLVYQVSKNPIHLGLIGLAEIIPFVSMLLFGGAWSDVFNRQRLMLGGIFSFFLISLGLYACASEIESGRHLPLVWIYGLIFLTGLARAVLSPAQNALLGQLVPASKITKASVWNSLIFHVGSVGGPAAGGLLYGYIGVSNSFLIVCILILMAVLGVFRLRKVPDPPQATQREPILNRITEGIRFVWRHQILLPGMLMDMVAVLFGGAIAVLPLFADQVLHLGPEGLGWLRAAPAVGSLCMASVFTRYNPGANAGKWLLVSVAIFGLTNLIFALSESFMLSFMMLMIGGAFDNVSAIIRMSVVQIFTPDHMRGRVSAVNAIFIGSSNELGAFESGIAARFLGLVPSVVFGAAITFLSVGITGWKSKPIRNLNLSPNPSEV